MKTQSPKKEIHPFSKYLPDKDPSTFPSVHPHADIFPMIKMEEMQAMAEDIKTKDFVITQNLTRRQLTKHHGEDLGG
jgi:hypothetical protein